jgi:hypothetical protein
MERTNEQRIQHAYYESIKIAAITLTHHSRRWASRQSNASISANTLKLLGTATHPLSASQSSHATQGRALTTAYSTAFTLHSKR